MFIDFSGLICFDLETANSHKTLDDLGNENPRMVYLWKRLCEKRRKAGDERFLECVTDDEAYINNAALYAEFGRIINASFGKYVGDAEGPGVIQVISIGGENERGIIEATNKIISSSAWVCGHNVKGFDIPFFSRRAYIHQILPDANIDTVTKKPWDVRVLDTMQMWNFGGAFNNFTSLDLLSTCLNIESPKLEHFGGQVSNLFWEDSDYEEIALYCEGDVISTLKVLVRFNNPSIDLSEIKVERKELRRP